MQKETLKERVYRGIYEAVTNGEYRPNDILTENQMIEKFGVSKSPVREALVELCKDGVLINIPAYGLSGAGSYAERDHGYSERFT